MKDLSPWIFLPSTGGNVLFSIEFQLSFPDKDITLQYTAHLTSTLFLDVISDSLFIGILMLIQV